MIAPKQNDPGFLDAIEAEPSLIGTESAWVDSGWNVDAMKSRFGSKQVVVTDTLNEDRPRHVDLGSFLEYCLLVTPQHPYYLHWWFGPVEPALYENLLTPWFLRSWFDRLPDAVNPQLRWYLAGPAGSGTDWHVDTWGTSAWCYLVSGRKIWEFEDGFQLDQKPGQIVYAPSGWRHRVWNVAASFALSGNIINRCNHLMVRRAAQDSSIWCDIIDKLARAEDGTFL